MYGTKIVMIVVIGIGGFLALFGLGLFLSANSAQRVEDEFNKNAIEVQAYVESVDKKVKHFEGLHNKRTKTYYETRVSYTVDEKEYEDVKLSEALGDKYIDDVGTYITLYCNKNDPLDIRTEIRHDDLDLLSIGLGIGVIIIGVTLAGGVIIAVKVDDYRRKKAIENMKNGYK